MTVIYNATQVSTEQNPGPMLFKNGRMMTTGAWTLSLHTGAPSHWRLVDGTHCPLGRNPSTLS